MSELKKLLSEARSLQGTSQGVNALHDLLEAVVARLDGPAPEPPALEAPAEPIKEN